MFGSCSKVWPSWITSGGSIGDGRRPLWCGFLPSRIESKFHFITQDNKVSRPLFWCLDYRLLRLLYNKIHLFKNRIERLQPTWLHRILPTVWVFVKHFKCFSSPPVIFKLLGIKLSTLEIRKSLQPLLPVKSSLDNAIHPWASSSMLYQRCRIPLSCQQVSQMLNCFPNSLLTMLLEF